MIANNLDANNISIFDRKFFLKLTIVYFIYSFCYSIIYYKLGALFASSSMMLFSIFYPIIIVSLELKSYKKLARMVFLIASLSSCLAAVVGVQHNIGVEYFFLACMLAPAALYKSSEKKWIIFGQLLSLLAWTYQIWGEKPDIPVNLFPKEFPAQFFTHMNFLGAIGVVVIIIRFLITRQHESIKKLEKSNIRQELFLEGANLGSWEWVLDTNQVFFDKRWFEILGMETSGTGHLLTTRTSKIHPDDFEINRIALQNYIEGKISKYQSIYRMAHTNGEWIWILDRGLISEFDKNGKPLRFIGTYNDITALKELEVLNNNVQSFARIGGWELDIKSSKTKWTDEVYRIHGLPVGFSVELVDALSFYAPHERERISNLVTMCISGKPYENEVFEFHDIDKKTKWVKVNGTPVRDSQGNISKLLGTFQDVTDLVLAESDARAEKIKANQNFKLALLGEMSAGVAHEINNPLAIISGTVSILSKHIDDREKFHQKIKTLEKSVLRITKIVSGLKKFSRSSEQNSYEHHCLSSIIKESIELSQTKIQKFNFQIELDLISNAIILCNEIEIEQVILNLISNAIDANNENTEKWIKISLIEDTQYFILRVSDSGHGIAAEIQAKLFDPFFTTKVVGEGTGLGLSISRGIIEEHKATIEVLKNVPNTIFEIKFPSVRNASGQSHSKLLQSS